MKISFILGWLGIFAVFFFLYLIAGSVMGGFLVFIAILYFLFLLGISIAVAGKLWGLAVFSALCAVFQYIYEANNYSIRGGIAASIVTFLIWVLFAFFVALISTNSKTENVPINKTLIEVDSMDGYEFERYMKSVYTVLDYSVHHTPYSGDQGADLILTSKKGIKTAVQTKRSSYKITNKAVQEVVAAKGFHGCIKGLVVTNNYFTPSAIELARANNIDLVDRDGLNKLINEASQADPNKNT